jgi:hypothetical protein
LRLRLGDQPSDLAGNLGDGADVGQRVQRNGDVEVIFQLADELQDLERVETEVGEQLALRQGIDRPAAETLENLDGVAFEPVVRMRGLYARRGSPSRGIGCIGQAVKCNMNVTCRATLRSTRTPMSLGFVPDGP